MRVWRLARQAHAALDGEGARIHGGRWNAPGRPLIYTAGSAALAVLEVRVHLDLALDMLPEDYQLMAIDTGAVTIDEAPATALDDPRSFGERWLAENRTAAVRVPSIIVPEDWNLLMNPQHPEAAGIAVVSRRPFRFDTRLFR